MGIPSVSRSRDPIVWVVIPNRNGRPHLEYSLKSLEATVYKNYRAVLVDNASVDESVAFAGRFEKVEILRNENDLGFAGAVNRGIEHSLARGGEFIAVFSNDIKVRPDWIDLVINKILREDEIGVIGFSELGRDVVFEGALLHAPLDPAEITYRASKFVSGPLNIYRAKALIDVGGFDESYYLYGEDNDLSLRLSRIGSRILISSVPFWHYRGGYSENIGIQRRWLMHRNTFRYTIKNEPVREIPRTLAAMFYRSILTPPPQARVQLRIWGRIRGVIVNTCLFLAAGAWTVCNLREFLRLRYRKGAGGRGGLRDGERV